MATSPGAASAAKLGPAPRAAGHAAAAAPVVQQPVQIDEDVAQAQPGAIEDVNNGAAAPEQPVSSTNFDYANPQRYFAARQAEQAAEAAQQQAQQGQRPPVAAP